MVAPAEVTVKIIVAVDEPTPLSAVTVKFVAPRTTLGVHEMRPVALFKTIPVGRAGETE